MIKRTLIGAVFVAASAAAVGVSAGTTANLKGSDTLFDFTNLMIASCPGTVGPYAGTGSGNGQNAMTNGSQQVAPMSRFLNAGACTGAPIPDAGADRTDPSQAAGLVIGLDGISVLGWNQTFTFGGDAAPGDDAGFLGCNGHPNVDCLDDSFEVNTGAAYDRTITCTGACSSNLPADGSTYKLNGWRDVLRVLFAGFDHSTVASGTGAAAWAARDCNSPIRQAIANNYGNFFENNCIAQAGSNATGTAADSTNGRCTMIRHVFRRDDFSGTTDTVVSLLNLPAIVQPSATQGTGATPFCNAVRPAFVFPSPQPTCLVGSDNTWDPTVCVAVGTGPCTAANVAANTCTDPVSGRVKEKGVYRSTMQDNDPIRRPCANNEQVCSHSKSLGLLLSMSEPFIAAPQTNADRYNATTPSASTFASVPIPEIFDAISQRKILASLGALCPNGDTGSAGCLAPALATSPGAFSNPQVLSRIPNSPALVLNGTSVPLIAPSPPGLAEGRQYNAHLYLYNGATTSASYQVTSFKIPQAGQGTAPNGLPLTGAYYRIHATTSLNPVTGRTCQLPDMTDQIGCLVEASPCSTGYAGLGALANNANTGAVKLKRPDDAPSSPSQLCIQEHFLYPFARKLYLNTLVGFGQVNGQELQLAGCMTDFAQPSFSSPTPDGLVTTNIVAAGFVPLFSHVNQGRPYCEDFNEALLCGRTDNVDACRPELQPQFDYWPDNDTVCGDSFTDSYEDCDDGLANGPPPARCSTTCRFNN